MSKKSDLTAKGKKRKAAQKTKEAKAVPKVKAATTGKLASGLNFDHLTATQFEDFTLALVKHLGFQSVDWRKGTPKDSSPSDGGRDIEADWPYTEVDGYPRSEKWWIDAKHYTSSAVPPEALSGALGQALLHQPDVLLIVASGWLSNPAKDAIGAIPDRYPFRVKVWERPHLEDFILRKGALSVGIQFGLVDDPAKKIQLHEAHLRFATQYSCYRFDFLADALLEADSAIAEDFVVHSLSECNGKEWAAPTGVGSAAGAPTLEELIQILGERCAAIQASSSRDHVIAGLITTYLQLLVYDTDESYRGVRTLIENLAIDRALETEDPLELEKALELEAIDWDQRYASARRKYDAFCETILWPFVTDHRSPNSRYGPEPEYD